MALPIDRSIVGQEFDRTTFPPVTEDQILAYARAYGETNPLHTEARAAENGPYGALVAPPTFVFRLRGRHFMPKQLPAGLGRNGFDAGKDAEFFVPVRPGDVLTTVTTVHDLYEKTGRSGTMIFLVFRTLVTNQNEETVAIIDQKMMFRNTPDRSPVSGHRRPKA